MTRRKKFPSPEEYGRRLAEARRREERRRQEPVRQANESLDKVLGELGSLKGQVQEGLLPLQEQLALTTQTVSSLETLLGRPQAVDAQTLERAVTQLLEALSGLEAGLLRVIGNLDKGSPDSPAQVDPQQFLQIFEQLDALQTRPQVTRDEISEIVQSIEIPQGILTGSALFRVLKRDQYGDIQVFRVDPATH